MKTIGLIGGMSWQSTRIYYDLLNEMVAARLGGLHSAEILMRSVDFAGFEAAMQRGDWTAIESRLGDEAAALERGGAGCVLLCSNTMHKLYGTGVKPFVKLVKRYRRWRHYCAAPSRRSWTAGKFICKSCSCDNLSKNKLVISSCIALFIIVDISSIVSTSSLSLAGMMSTVRTAMASLPVSTT